MMPPTVDILIEHYSKLPLRRLFILVSSPPGFQSLDSLYAAIIALERRNALWLLDYLEPGLHAMDRDEASKVIRPPKDYMPMFFVMSWFVKFAVIFALALT